MLQDLDVQTITLTPTASKAVSDILAERKLEGYALRVYVAGGGCCGVNFGMALDNNIRDTDFKYDSEGLYNLAVAHVQPSVYEGFGLTVLEAFACGTPVICGRGGGLAEVAGDAATLVDTTDINALAKAIQTVKKSGREIAQAAKFSWKATAEKTYAAYQKALVA